MNVGVDLDGVVYAFKEAFVGYLQEQGYSHCTLEAATSTWYFFEGWGMTLDEYLQHFHAGVDAGYIFTKGEPEEGTVEATHKLHENGHKVHIVTDRSMGTRKGESARATVKWLAEHGFYFDSITFTADKTSVPTQVFIDDKVENYIALWNAGTTCYLLDRPWNQRDHPAWVNASPADQLFGALRTTGLPAFVEEIQVDAHVYDNS